jgi:hypothetical protein
VKIHMPAPAISEIVAFILAANSLQLCEESVNASHTYVNYPPENCQSFYRISLDYFCPTNLQPSGLDQHDAII